MNFSPVPCARSCAVTGEGGDCDKGARQCRLAYERKDLAIQALARSATISDLSTRHGVSRKVIYAQPGEYRVITGAALTSWDVGERLRSGRPHYHRRAPRRLRGAHLRVLQQLRGVLVHPCRPSWRSARGELRDHRRSSCRSRPGLR
jgi:hypothetical protein